jgi:hypothetical protein
MQAHNNKEPSQWQDQRYTPALDETLELADRVKRRPGSPVGVLVNASGA